MPRQEDTSRPTVRRATVLPQVAAASATTLEPAGGSAGAAPAPRTGVTPPTGPAAGAQEAGSSAAPATVAEPAAPEEGSEPASEPASQSAPGTAAHAPTATDPDAAASPAVSGEATPPGSAASAAGDEPPSGRPNKPLLAAAALGGTLLIGVPFLFLGLQGDDGKADSSAASRLSSDTLLRDDRPAGEGRAAYAPATPSSSPSVSPKHTTTAPAKATPQTQSQPQDSAPAKPEASRSPSPAKTQSKPAQPLSSTGGALPQSADFVSVTGVMLKNVMTGMCVDLPNYGAGKLNGPVNQFTCNNSVNDNQRWDLLVAQSGAGPAGADLFTIRNSKDGYCLDLPNYGGNPAGTGVFEWHCNGVTTDNQLWFLDKRSSGKFWIRNYSSGNRCLDVRGYDGVGGKDTPIAIFECDIEDDHLWSFS